MLYTHQKNTIIATTLLLIGLSTSYAATPVVVNASADDGNSASNTVDNNLDTRWSADGNDGSQWIQYDFGNTVSVSAIDIAFHKGDIRSTYFRIESSNDASTWITQLDTLSSGDKLEQETFNLNDAITARYIRYVGFGNSSNSWNSVTEIDFIDGDTTSENEDPINVPALIQAEDYTEYSDTTEGNSGGEYTTDDVDVQTTTDIDGGYNIGWIKSGEWLMYSINVSEAGDYVANIRVASLKTTGAFQISIDGILTNNIDIGSTGGWQTWVTETVDLGSLNVGEHSIVINMTGNDFNLNWIDIQPNIVNNGGDGEDGSDGDTYTATPDTLDDVIALAVGGDEIIVTGSGEISIKDLSFDSQLLIRAENLGGTTLTNATLTNSNNITLQGFIFGPNDESTLLKIVNSTNIKVLHNLFDHKDITESQTSLVMTQASDTIEIAYNEFRDKNQDNLNGTKITGSFIKTQYDDPLMSKNIHIHHNHFNNIAPYLVNGTPAGDSDREAIAMGIADSQDVVTNNIVEYNLFENCDGENEIITVKTSSNIFRYNTFKNSMGSLSFRLGTNNQAYGNYFYGLGTGDTVADENYETGGIRVYGSGHTIYDNYMENLTGVSWRRPILVDSGDTSDSTGNDSHETSTNITVYNNTIIDSLGGGIHIGGENYSNMPTNISITDNIVVSSHGILFNNVAEQSSNTWSNNSAYATGSAIVNGGGALDSSELNILSSEPTITTSTPLTSNNVGVGAN